jgi:hypothetical protein
VIESPTPIAEEHLISEIQPVLKETVEKMDFRGENGPDWEAVSRQFLADLREKGYLLVEYREDNLGTSESVREGN